MRMNPRTVVIYWQHLKEAGYGLVSPGPESRIPDETHCRGRGSDSVGIGGVFGFLEEISIVGMYGTP